MLYNKKMKKSLKVILASASPRRIELLKKIVEDFDVVVSNVDESISFEDPAKAVQKIAERKASAIHENAVIIAADTIVFFKKALGKPKDEEDAVNTLLSLNGKKHLVYTGVCVSSPNKRICFVDCTEVYFKELSEDDIRDYVKYYLPLDKAGSYGIQDGVLVEKIVGSYDNVVGLPTEKLKEVLDTFFE